MPTPEKHQPGKPQGRRRARNTAPGNAASNWFGDLNQTDFEIAFFEQVLSRSPNFILVLKSLGELLARQGLYERSVQIDQHLVSLLPDDCVARYNFACSLARQGSGPRAVAELALAIEHGYDDFSHMEVDPDLDTLRDLPAYQALLQKHTR